MLLKFVLRAAVVAGVAYGVKKVLDATGVTEKLVAIRDDLVDRAIMFANDNNLFVSDETKEEESAEAMSTPQAAAWANAHATGGAGGKY